MPDTHSYGQRLSATFRIEPAPTLVTRTLRKADIAVTECASDMFDQEISTSLPEDDAYIVGLQLRDYLDCRTWEQGRFVAHTDIRAGETHLYDLKRDPRFLIDKGFHWIGFYIPRAAFDALADEAHAPRISELDYAPGRGFDDEIVRNLGTAMRAALARPEQASRLFVDHVTLAIAAHVAQFYGGLRRIAPPARGGLAGWQQRRACELLDANLTGETPLRTIAAECGLSVSHFSRAFRQSIGVAPHRWLLQRRVEVAKTLMRDRRLQLAEVALAAGFADQSHFTRIFSKTVGISPGAWRRCLEIESWRSA